MVDLAKAFQPIGTWTTSAVGRLADWETLGYDDGAF